MRTLGASRGTPVAESTKKKWIKNEWKNECKDEFCINE